MKKLTLKTLTVNYLVLALMYPIAGSSVMAAAKAGPCQAKANQEQLNRDNLHVCLNLAARNNISTSGAAPVNCTAQLNSYNSSMSDLKACFSAAKKSIAKK